MTARSLRIADGELPPFEGEDGFPVRHQGELLGAISVAFPPGDPITPAKSRLVEDLAAQAGLVLQERSARRGPARLHASGSSLLRTRSDAASSATSTTALSSSS